MTNVNNARARDGNTALQAFQCESTDLEMPVFDEDAFPHMIAALFHLCQAQGWSFDRMIDRGRAIYREDLINGPPANADFAE